MNKEKAIVMLGTSFDSMGGVSSVINGYKKAGLFERNAIIYLATHTDGAMLQKLVTLMRAWLRQQWLVLRGRVRLLHVHMSSNASFWRKLTFLVPAFLCRVPVILHLHGGAFDRFYERHDNPLKKFLIRYVFDSVDHIIVLSDARKRWIQSISRNRHVHTIYNAVELPAVASYDALSERLLFLGQLSTAKGVFDLLHAFSAVLTRHPRARLDLAGDGAQQELQQAIGELGLGAHVRLLGWVAGSERDALLRESAVFVLPSYAEGMPMSVLEAMAAGIPVVATRVGGIPEAVAGDQEGILVAAGDIDALAAALDKLLSDPGIRHEMGARARRKVETTFSYARILPRIEALYQQFGSPAQTTSVEHHAS